MVVVGVTGRIGSGKDELAKVLNQSCGVPVLAVGDFVKEMAAAQAVTVNRENLHRLSKQVFEAHGRDYFITQVIQKIEAEDWQSVIITGIRTPADSEVLRERFGSDFLLVRVDVDEATLRYERLKQRNNPRDPASFSEFQAQEQEEEQLFQLSETLEKADLAVNNNGTLYDFHQAIQKNLISNGFAKKLKCDFTHDA